MSFFSRWLHRKKKADISKEPVEQENKDTVTDDADSEDDRPGVSKRAVIISCVLIAGAVCAGIWQNDMSVEAVDSGESQRVSTTAWPHTTSHYNLQRTEWAGAGAAIITPVTYDFGKMMAGKTVKATEAASDNDGSSSSSGGSSSGGSPSDGITRPKYGRTIIPPHNTNKGGTGNTRRRDRTSARAQITDKTGDWESKIYSLISSTGNARGLGGLYKYKERHPGSRPSNASKYNMRLTWNVVYVHGSSHRDYNLYRITIETKGYSASNGRVTGFSGFKVISVSNCVRSDSNPSNLISINALTAHAADEDADDEDDESSDAEVPENYNGDAPEEYDDKPADGDDSDDDDSDSEDSDDDTDTDDDDDKDSQESEFEKAYKGALGSVQYKNKDGNYVTIYSTWYLDQGIKTINNVRDDYIETDKSLLFVPRSFMSDRKTDLWKRNIAVELVSSPTTSKKINLTEHRIYGNAKVYPPQIKLLNIDQHTTGKAKTQRKENVKLLMDNVMTDNGTGVFSGYLHKLFREDDHSKWESEEIEGDTGTKYRVHDHDKLFDYLRSHRSELFAEAKKSGYYNRTLLYYGLSANVYKSGNYYYMCPKTLSDYSALSAYNYLQKSSAAKDDLKLIRDNNKKKIKFYGNKIHHAGSKDKRRQAIEDEQDLIDADAKSGNTDGLLSSHSTEKDVYNYYHLNSSYSYNNIKDFKARVGQSRIGKNNYDCAQYSQTASYINNEYAVAYLDSLLCGYNIAYNKYVRYCSDLKNEKDKNHKPLKASVIKARKAKAYKLVQRWKNAVNTELDASDTHKSTSEMACMRIDVVGGTYSRGRNSLTLASFGEYAAGTYRTGTNIALMSNKTGDANKKENNKSVSQSFYGVTGGMRSEKIDKNSPWYDGITYTPVTIDGKQHWGRNGVKTVSDGLDVGNVYKRIYKAAKKNSKGRPDYSVDDNDWAFITWSQNVLDNNKVEGSKNFSGVAKRARGGEMLYDRIDNIHQYNYGYAHTSPVSLYRVARESEQPKRTAFELRVHSEKANGSANGAVLTDNNYPDGVGKLKNDNGIEIHDTAETAGGTKKDKGITVTKAGANIMQDRISLKIDSPNTNGIFDKLQGEDVKIVVKYEIGAEKDASLDPTSDSSKMKLVDMSKAQDKENILADAEKKKNYTYLDKTKLKIDSLNSKSDDKREDFTPTPESAGTDKPKPKDGEDDNAIYYEPASENNDSQVSASDSTSVYYGKDSAWLDAKDAKNNTYKNLVWQQGISEMADTGFSFSVPDEKKWEHYYRICIKAKIGVFKPGDDSSVYDQPYYDDSESRAEGWSEGYIYTNPVYVTYHVTRSRPDSPNEF